MTDQFLHDTPLGGTKNNRLYRKYEKPKNGQPQTLVIDGRQYADENSELQKNGTSDNTGFAVTIR